MQAQKCNSVDELRNLAKKAAGPCVRASSEKIQKVMEKYFLGEPEAISKKFGSREVRNKLAMDLTDVQNALVTEAPYITATAKKLAGRAISLGKTAVVSYGAAVAGFLLATVACGMEGQATFPVSKIAPHIRIVFGISAAFAAGGMALQAVAGHIGKKIGAMLAEAAHVREFIKGAVEFASAAWKTEIMKSFRH